MRRMFMGVNIVWLVRLVVEMGWERWDAWVRTLRDWECRQMLFSRCSLLVVVREVVSYEVVGVYHRSYAFQRTPL